VNSLALGTIFVRVYTLAGIISQIKKFKTITK
jgi:hypothetical protein